MTPRRGDPPPRVPVNFEIEGLFSAWRKYRNLSGFTAREFKIMLDYGERMIEHGEALLAQAQAETAPEDTPTPPREGGEALWSHYASHALNGALAANDRPPNEAPALVTWVAHLADLMLDAHSKRFPPTGPKP